MSDNPNLWEIKPGRPDPEVTFEVVAEVEGRLVVMQEHASLIKAAEQLKDMQEQGAHAGVYRVVRQAQREKIT